MQPSGAEHESSWPLTGRDEELDLLRRSVPHGVVVVGGAAGVGKTRLVRDWCRATTDGALVVTATAATATIPFGAFARWVPDHLLPGGDRLSMLRGLADRVAAPSSTVVVDDAHLLDDAPAALLLHLADHHPTVLIATVRTGEPTPDAVTALWRDGRGTRIDLLPLSRLEVERLVAARLPGRLDPVARDGVWTRSAGNPLFVRELIDAALDDGTLRRDGDTWRWARSTEPPARLVEVVENRLARASAPDRRLLEIVARGEPLPVAVLARLDVDQRLDHLVRAGLVTTTPEHGEVALPHPLYSEVLRRTTPPLADRRNCADLVGAVLAESRSTAERFDPLQVGVWAVDGAVADVDQTLLLDAAQRAVALRDDRLGLRLAQAAQAAGAGPAAALLTARCLAELGHDDAHRASMAVLIDHDDAWVRAEAAAMAAFHEVWSGDGVHAARSVLDQALAAIDGPPAATVSATAATFALYDLDLPATVGHCADIQASTVDEALRLQAVTLAANAAALGGRPEPAETVLADRLGDILAITPVDPVPPAWTAVAVYWSRLLTGRTDDCHTFFLQVLETMDLTNEPAFRALPLVILGRIESDQGRVGSGADRLRDAIDLLADDSRYWFGRPTMALAELAVALAQAGQGADAAAALDEAHRREHVDTRYTRHHLLRAEAWTSAAAGDLRRAASHSMALADLGADRGAVALELVGLADATRLGAAAVAADRLQALARRTDPDVSSLRAWAAFASALRADDGAALDAASIALEHCGARLAAAEAAAAATSIHTASGLRRRAATSLDRASLLRDWCGPVSTPLLTAVDLTPLGPTLTTREREVAFLAAAGRTNREISEALGISLRTVHSHLNHAYTKLGTSDRGELLRLLGSPPAAATS